MNMSIVALAIGIGLCTWFGSARSAGPQDKDRDPDHAQGHDHDHDHGSGDMKDKRPVELNEHHKVLHRGVGKWKVVSKQWMPGHEEPVVSYGSSNSHLILDGLGTAFDLTTTGDQGTVHGFGMATWNTITRMYEGAWVSTYSYNGIDEFVGTYDPLKQEMNWNMEVTMPGSAKTQMRFVEKYFSDDKWVMTFFMLVPGGQEIRITENTYTRIK